MDRERRPVDYSYVITQGTFLIGNWGNNLIADNYFDINLDVLWQTITEDLPQMLAALPCEDDLDRREAP